MDKMIKIIKSDLKTIEKLEKDENFKTKLLEAINVAKMLGVINNEIAYYQYKMSLRQLDGVNFFELSALDRFENNEYYKELIDLYQKIYGNIPKKEHRPSKIIVLRTIKNRRF